MIAIFYGGGVDFPHLIVAAIVTGALWYTNKQGYVRPVLYGVLGAVLLDFCFKIWCSCDVGWCDYWFLHPIKR